MNYIGQIGKMDFFVYCVWFDGDCTKLSLVNTCLGEVIK